MGDLLVLDREGEMKWRVLVELAGEADGIELREVSLGECATAACSPETLGLSIAEGQKTLAGLHHHLVEAQTEEYCRSRRCCQHCGAQRPLKDIRPRRLMSLFGVRPSKTWGDLRRFMKRSPGPSLCSGMVLVESSVHHRRSDLEHQMRSSR